MNRNNVFIIAEAGVNHNGDVDMAIQLANAARDAGADAVKFQTFRAEDVVTPSAVTADYQKNNTGEVMEKLAENRLPFIITQNGEAKAVLMDVHDYDEKNETIAMLKRLIVSAKEREEGQYRAFDDVVRDLRAKYSEDRDGKKI